jgi:hypothetical protein
MEKIKPEDMWKTHAQEIEYANVLNMQSWVLNSKTFEYLQLHKAQSRLRSMAYFKTGAILLGILWVLFLGELVYGNHGRNLYFSVSAGMIMLFSILAIAVYVKHIVLINEINTSDNVIQVQEKLTELQTSTIKGVRILWLQLPFYTTFFWSREWMAADMKFWLIAFPITLLFAAIAIWLYRNISYRNSDKKWFRVLFAGREWTPMIKAANYLKEIQDFRDR